ncbi:hypothetical protein [Enterovibrio baiacu]|uniref:hypothetical protein n=1 Tax=Enterovibrio baiacu TaxID=2491023 RepID=UPI003D0D8407
MLKLVADNPENNDKQAAGEHIRQYAPAFAAEVVRFMIRQSDYDELKESVKQQFLDWWQLSLPSGPPEDQYESVYWYLIYLIESRQEHELRGNRFVKQRVQECACYLINKGKVPDFARGIRP